MNNTVITDEFYIEKDKNILSKVERAIDDFYQIRYRSPGFLLLGFKDYYSLCAASVEPGEFLSNLNEFNGVEIVVDDTVESIIKCLPHTDLKIVYPGGIN